MSDLTKIRAYIENSLKADKDENELSATDFQQGYNLALKEMLIAFKLQFGERF